MTRITAAYAWAKARLMEGSTWIALGHVAVAASVYPYPWCFVAVLISLAQMAMPDKQKVAA